MAVASIDLCIVGAGAAGLAAGISFLLGIVAKIGIAFTMVGIFGVAWLV